MSNNYFKDSEFLCKCGCGQGPMNPLLISRLNEFREFLKLPLIVTSGFRCKTHNAKVGGASNSYHLVGSAADIFTPTLTGPQLYLKLLEFGQSNFPGVGIGRNFIHIDVRTRPALFFYDGLTLKKLHPDQM